jgi:hypothetical protein
MAWPIFMTQIVPAASDHVQSEGGSVQAIPVNFYYFMVTGKTSTGNGQSFVELLSDLLSASSSVVWTVRVTSDFRLRFAHDDASAVDLIIDTGLAYLLGFDVPYTPGGDTTVAVPATTGYTTPYHSPWMWDPDRWVSMTGPQLFDPAFQSGIRVSAGASAYAPDGSASFVANGTQTEAVFMFTGVEPAWRTHPDGSTLSVLYDNAQYRHRDFVTWWQWGPRLGRRILFWRDRSLIIDDNAPDTDDAPYPYVEYYPQDSLRKEPTFTATAPPYTRLNNITVALRLTERGEAVY